MVRLFRLGLVPVVLGGFVGVVVFHAWRGVRAEPPRGASGSWRTTDPVVRAINRGVALMEQYDYGKAVEAFEQALKLDPKSAEARLNLAMATYNRSGKDDVKKAEALVTAVLEQEPDNLRALYFRGIICQHAGRDEQATSCFERVVRETPHDAYAWYLLARCKSHLDQPNRAELERAVQENPGLASAYYDLMRVALQAGDRDQAKRYQERFVKLRENLLSEAVSVPQYRQMGPLSLVRPMSATPGRSVTSGELSAGAAQTVFQCTPALRFERRTDTGPAATAGKLPDGCAGGVALGDVNNDGHVDIVVTTAVRDGRRGLALLLGREDRSFADATSKSGLGVEADPISCSFGDYDNDGHVDLFVSCAGPNHLFRGRGDGTFEEVSAKTQTAGAEVISVSSVFLDADHDGDLDIYVCNLTSVDGKTPAGNQLLNNNADGTFTDIAVQGGVDCAGQASIMLAPGDIDGDRDTDLVVFNQGAPARVFFNDRFGKYHEQRVTDEPIGGDSGGVLQDFNGDGRPDLLVLPGSGTPGKLYVTEGVAALKPSAQFDQCAQALVSHGEPRTARIADVDLDGDLDVLVVAAQGHVLLNDGWGRFVLKTRVWPEMVDDAVIPPETVDLTGDGLADWLCVRGGKDARIELLPTQLTPPANWLAVTPTGMRGKDKRTRSPASGYGTRVELRCGLHSQTLVHAGLNGGICQSQLPLILGLNGATQADYLAITWPDGVTQSEIALASGVHHRISETQRKVSSCPVLFAWNGKRFEFVGDFAGVGGLGYFVAPGEYAFPQIEEHVKIEPGRLQSRNGQYELRICEPMEEVAYLDRLELLAVDHPKDVRVYPDERLAVTGPPPTHELLCVDEPIFPVSAYGPNGGDCTSQLAEVDRVYAYPPPTDRRFYGFCEPHTLVLDFGDRLAFLGSGQRVFLFIHGSIEYPYSQTTFAAGQARVEWQPTKIEQQTEDGTWETIVPDAGAPGGMGRMITVELTGELSRGRCKLRLSTNLEVYYDQIFIAPVGGTRGVTVRTVPLVRAELRRLGFPLEYSPDGRHPLIYTYDMIEPTSAFKTLKGAYTRYGRVDALLAESDDRYVVFGTGDEVAVGFDARALTPPPDGWVRSFILKSHAYCKDMDLYTAEPDTVEPLPFRGMTAYPYPSDERYPDGEEFRRYREEFNTRWIN